jgi:hypothetical protein
MIFSSSKKTRAAVIGYRTMEIDGQEVKVPLYSEGKARPAPSMRVRGQVTSDAKLVSDMTIEDIQNFRRPDLKKRTSSIFD